MQIVMELRIAFHAQLESMCLMRVPIVLVNVYHAIRGDIRLLLVLLTVWNVLLEVSATQQEQQLTQNVFLAHITGTQVKLRV